MKSYTLFILLSFLGCSSSNNDQVSNEPKTVPDTGQNTDTPDEKLDMPNILIILADDLTTNDIGVYGGRNVPTPNIDKLAFEGKRFTKAFTSSSMCTPSRTALYTGLYPVKNGAHKNGPQGTIKSGIESMGILLKREGYRVGLTGKKHIFPQEAFGFEIVPGFTGAITGQRADYNVEEIKPFMTRRNDQPFCLVIGSTLPHAPWTVGDRGQFDMKELVLPGNWMDTPETRQRYRDYLAEVSALDKQVGDILKSLEEIGKEDNTLILFLGEQGAQFAGNKWTLWEPGLHSAIIAKYPKVIAEGTVANQLIQYVDVLPTLFEMAGKDIPSGFDGNSFAGILKGESQEEIREYAFGVHSNTGEGPSFSIRSVRDKDYKLVWNLDYVNNYHNKYVMKSLDYNSWEEAAQNNDEGAVFLVKRYENRPEFELYDLQKDPYEFNNLANVEGHQQKLARMKLIIENWMHDQGDPGKSIDQ